MRLHLHGGMLGAAEFALGAEIEVADALAAGYRIHQDPDDGFIHGTPMMRCKWSAWVGSPVAPRPERSRKEALLEAAEIAHVVHEAAECSTDGMLSTGMRARSYAAEEIRNAIRALAEGDN